MRWRLSTLTDRTAGSAPLDSARVIGQSVRAAWWRKKNSVDGIDGPWAVAPGTDNKSGRPIVLRINTGYIRASDRRQYPVRVECTLPLQHARADGMPADEEHQDLRTAEDVLQRLLTGQAVLVAVITGRDRREFLFQARDTAPMPVFDRDANASIVTYDVRVLAISDPEWSEYHKLASYVTKTSTV